MTTAGTPETGSSTRMAWPEAPPPPSHYERAATVWTERLGLVGSAVFSGLGVLPATLPAVVAWAVGAYLRKDQDACLETVAEHALTPPVGYDPPALTRLLPYLENWSRTTAGERVHIKAAVRYAIDPRAPDNYAGRLVTSGALDRVLRTPELLEGVGPEAVLAFAHRHASQYPDFLAAASELIPR